VAFVLDVEVEQTAGAANGVGFIFHFFTLLWGPTVISYFAAGPHPHRLSRLASRLAAYFVATFRLVNFQLLNIPIDETLLILGRDVFLDPLRRDADRQIRGVADQLALGDLHLLIHLPAR